MVDLQLSKEGKLGNKVGCSGVVLNFDVVLLPTDAACTFSSAEDNLYVGDFDGGVALPMYGRVQLL